MSQIDVTQTQEFPNAEFEVTVSSGSTTHHRITVSKDYYEKLTAGKITPGDLIKKSFEFLLVREPNTAILPQFDLSLIQNYFPSFEKEIQNALQPEK